MSALAELAALLGPRFSAAEAIRDHHARDESHLPPVRPDAVVFPQSTAEVAEILRRCAAHGTPVIPWGTGTSLEGHVLALNGGVSLDLSGMNRVRAIHAEDMDAVVEPGVTRSALNAALRDTGLFFPIDPGADASLGGMAATRASGTAAVRYGTMRDAVLALEVVLADGRVIRTGSRARKSAAGYDLTRLFVGSEGTLGVITELTLRLAGQPEAISAAICAFPDIGSAVRTTIETIQMGVPVARIEFVDALMVRGFNAHAGRNMPETPHLFLEFHGSPAGVAEQAETVAALARDNGATGFDWATRPEARSALWSMRHNGYYAALALRPGARAITTDVCVPISALAEAVERAAALVAEAGLMGPTLGHVGDGNFHVALLIDPADAAERAQAKAVATAMARMALELGGTITGEHGIGAGKAPLMVEEHGPALEVMRLLKAALDPGNILNPGKLLPA